MSALSPFTLACALWALAVTLLVGRSGAGARRWILGAALGALAGGAAWAAWHAAGDALRFAVPGLAPLAPAVLAAAAWRTRSLPRGMVSWRRWGMWSLGALGATAATLAAAGPSWGHRTDRLTVVFAADRSRSMDLVPDAAGHQQREEALGVSRMRPFDRVGRVAFGAEAVTEDPVHPRAIMAAAQEAAVGRDGTDLGAALRRALAEVPDDSAARVVLMTDGAANRGDALAAAAAAAAAGVPVDVLPMRAGPLRNLRVEGARAPSLANAGETFDLRVVTRATDPTTVEVRLLVDGVTTQRGRARVRAGEDVLTLRQTAPTPGLHRYEVEVSALDPALDQVAEDDRAGLFVRVRGASSVLILEGDPGGSTPLTAALRQGGFRVDEGGANGFPDDLAALASYDLVVLSDVPALSLSPDQMEQLRTYVRDLGGGLLLMGGDRSMGPGGYSRTPVEEISPVSFDMHQERRRASLSEVIAIDYSGSMAAVVGGYTKIALANEAAARSAMLLGPGDRLGVAHIDTTTAWTVPLGAVTDLAPVLRRIRAVGSGGGGIIVPIALRDGYAALGRETTNLRHLLLFADGDDAEEIAGTWVTVGQAFRAGITTSVVSLGRGSDTPELEHLAREGHGRFYLVEDALRLPTVFAQETILAARASLREERFRPASAAPDVVTRGMDFSAAPPLRGYVVTIPKPRASILLTGPDRDPVLATWQVGVGHVAAFTSDAKDRWGTEWLTWPGAPQLWVALARSLVRRDDSLVRVDADTTGGVLHVRASATSRDGFADSLRRLTARVSGPDGRVREVPLDPVGAGSYAADEALVRPGAYVVGVRDDALGAMVATTGALLLPGEELRPPEDPALLDRIAAMTGGRVRASAAGVFDDRVGLRRACSPLGPWLLVVSLAALLGSLSARRLGLPDPVARLLGRALDATRAAPAAPTGTIDGLVARRRRSATPVARTHTAPSRLRRVPEGTSPRVSDPVAESISPIATVAAALARKRQGATTASAQTHPTATARSGAQAAPRGVVAASPAGGVETLLARKRARRPGGAV